MGVATGLAVPLGTSSKGLRVRVQGSVSLGGWLQSNLQSRAFLESVITSCAASFW